MKLRENVPLAKLTTVGIGGPARWFAEPEAIADLVAALEWAERESLVVAVIGLGSNLLVSDAGFPGLALRLVGNLASVEASDSSRRGTVLAAGGGATLAVCLHRARDAGLGGLEFACAIPGTIGGAVWMNAGAYAGDLSRILVRALVATSTGATWFTPEELGMSYRRSGLYRGQVVAAAELQLVQRPVDEIRAEIARLQTLRKRSQPTNKRTFGSVFKNPSHEMTAGQMLDACGLRGFQIGGAQISPKHANFIENTGGATAGAVIELIAEARRRACRRFGVTLEPEVQLLGPIEVPPLDEA